MLDAFFLIARNWRTRQTHRVLLSTSVNLRTLDHSYVSQLRKARHYGGLNCSARLKGAWLSDGLRHVSSILTQRLSLSRILFSRHSPLEVYIGLNASKFPDVVLFDSLKMGEVHDGIRPEEAPCGLFSER